MQEVRVGKIAIGDGLPLVLICGPCVIESEEVTLFSAETLKILCRKLGIPLIFKSSFDKANRSSVDSFRGPGLDQGLFILDKVKKEFDVPVVTDIHTPEQARAAADVCDLIQIPAFLCRQTDLVVAAGETQKAVSVKKGQFMAPWDMKNVAEKITSTGNQNILLTERGFSFGYNNLITDLRAIPLMQDIGYPVCFDATHSVQLPGGRGSSSGGERRFVETLSKGALAAGANALFLEAHPRPSEAQSDKESQMPLGDLEPLLKKLLAIYEVVHA